MIAPPNKCGSTTADTYRPDAYQPLCRSTQGVIARSLLQAPPFPSLSPPYKIKFDGICNCAAQGFSVRSRVVKGKRITSGHVPHACRESLEETGLETLLCVVPRLDESTS
jgi:hypothetical protein